LGILILDEIRSYWTSYWRVLFELTIIIQFLKASMDRERRIEFP